MTENSKLLNISVPEVSDTMLAKACRVAGRQQKKYEDAEKKELKEKIKKLLKRENGVLVAHYYTNSDLQELADETGGCVADSLEMAKFGSENPAKTLVVAGVRFMGETAKILNPEKRVIMPDTEATCSLDLACPADSFKDFCDAHPEYTSVVYANTSAEVKARADWLVTSGIALPIIKHLAERGEKVLWAPDRHLGNYIARETGIDMLVWPGSCVVHERFSVNNIKELLLRHPQAHVLVHPESPLEIIELAHVVGSTTALINAVKNPDAQEFIVATEPGIFHKMKEVAPDKLFIRAANIDTSIVKDCESCDICPWMAMNGLENLAESLENGSNEILLDKEICLQARKPIQRMLDFAASSNK